jgi:DNA helicase-2/ATP-dependent DNA helicase PcrA
MIQAVRFLIETDELKPKPRAALKELVESISRWAAALEHMPQHELCETILEESGYVAMWKADRSADAAGRLENLKELVRSTEDFENLRGFLEHVSLVMEASEGEQEDRVTIMTLHGAKGLEFETVFLPGWEEALFPHPRALDEQGRAGLEEERRLAYVGLTRAKRRAKLYFASNRRIHGLWNATIPSRFVDELPEAHVDVTEGAGSGFSSYGQRGGSRFDQMQSFSGSNYDTPGWRRAQTNQFHANQARGGFSTGTASPKPLLEGEILARSTGVPARFSMDQRVFHIKFGYGKVSVIDGNKLTVDFDKAGRKMVLESFLQAG